MRALRSRLVCGLTMGLVTLVSAAAAHAQPAIDMQTVQWRDVRLQLSADWHKVSPDPDKNFDGKRILYERVEALHSLRLIVRPVEAPSALAPSEVANQFIDADQKTTSDLGTFTDWKNGTRTIGGLDYRFEAVHFTPASGPPLVDQNIVLVFPPDYGDRQRWYLVHWVDTHSATAPAKPLDEFDGIVASVALSPVGTQLLADDFSDPDSSAFRASKSTDNYEVGYVDGEFAIQKTNPDSNAGYAYFPAGIFADLSLAVDARVTAEDPGSVINLSCRRTATAGYYRVAFDPIRGLARLQRVKADGSFDDLTPWTLADATLKGTSSNHLELICRGTLVELDVNGARAVAVRNADLIEGTIGIGGAAFNGVGILPDVRFANLVVKQR